MNLSFWKKIKVPFFCLAPMADVTDAAFRSVIAKYGKPDVTWTEFVSADGLCHPEGRKKLLHSLKYTEKERPIVAQLFGANPEKMREAAALVEELGFDGLDINMGCPDKTIEKQGAGAATIKNIKLAREIIKAARESAPNIPVTIKTRIGFNKEEIDTWIAGILEEKLPALTVHLRTRKEMSKVAAHWELMPRIVALRDKISPETLIIGNGDVVDLEDARKKVEQYRCDGVMLGRAIFGTPWLFDNKKIEIKTEDKLKILVEHTKLFEKLLGKYKNFAIMKKHFKAYVNNFDQAKELRVELMEAKDAKEVESIVKGFLKSNSI